MKKYFVTLFLICIGLQCFFQLNAQPPGIDDSIMSIKRKWKKGENFVGAYDPALKTAQFQAIYKKTDSIAALFQQAYPQPTGTEATWYVSIAGEPYFKDGPSPYEYSCFFKYYYYNTAYKKLVTNDEPGTGATVYVNSFYFLIEPTGLITQIDNTSKNIYEVCNTDGEWKGYPIYKINDSKYKNYKMVLLTKDDALPWKPVSQFQYLEALRAKWKDETDKAIAKQDEGIEKNKQLVERIKSDKNISKDTRDKLMASAQKSFDQSLALKEKNTKALNDLLQKDLKKSFNQQWDHEQLSILLIPLSHLLLYLYVWYRQSYL